MSKMQGPDAGDQRAHLPQAAEVEVPGVRQSQDAEAEAEVTRDNPSHNVSRCKMVDDRDAAKLNRRRLLKNIAIGAAVTGLPALGVGNGLRGTAINHVSYQSADYKKTRDFYVFGQGIR
jgi:hypothetical protein